MNYKVAVYGLTQTQISHLAAALPDGYQVAAADCVTDLLVTDAVCSIVNTEKLGMQARDTLLAYYMDVGDRLVETVVWLADVQFPHLPSFVRCESFLELLTDLDNLINRAQIRYETMQMYSGVYAYIPKHAIAESVEADVYAALHRKYGDNPEKQIIGQVRRQWQAVLEAGATQQLAAVYELTRWLRRQGCAYRLDCKTQFQFVLFLLDIVQENPLSQYPIDYDPLKQKSRLLPEYIFYLPESLRTQINRWMENHWLCPEVHDNICFRYLQE